MAPRKIIIDTDPGVDDILAILLAFSALPEELEVLLISVTYGNIDVQNALRNIISLFYHVEKEIAWRESLSSRKQGFETLRRSKPLVAVGPEHPLADQMLMADFFHGRDGLGDIHKTHPHLSPADTWKHLFATADKSEDPAQNIIAEEMKKSDAIFTPSRVPAAHEILRLLRENEPDTITIVAIGPLTNLALAAAEDPETFLKVREVVVMGGNIDEPGNVRNPLPSVHVERKDRVVEPPFRLIKQPRGLLRDMLNERNQITPAAEFNTFADAVAAARVYALTSPKPHTTMPPAPPALPGMIEGAQLPLSLSPYPEQLSRRLKVTLFPLDITERHMLSRGEFNTINQPLLEQKSPLAEWMKAFMDATFEKVKSLHPEIGGDAVGLQLHDPLCIWYCMAGQTPDATWKISQYEDIRVETSGQWTRGACVVDRRSRQRRPDLDEAIVTGDYGNWLQGGAGNRLNRCIGSPGESVFGKLLMTRILAL